MLNKQILFLGDLSRGEINNLHPNNVIYVLRHLITLQNSLTVAKCTTLDKVMIMNLIIHLTAEGFVAGVLAVLMAVTHPDAWDALFARASELRLCTGVVVTAYF